MKKIKYNFWDTEENKMIEHDSQELILIPCIGGYGANKHFRVNSDDSEISRFDWASAYLIGGRYIPLQYIGLKDIDNIEIFEDHIIKPEKGKPKKVFFNNGGFAYSGKSKRAKAHPLYSQLIYQKRFKIIGNIYENETLLSK